MVASKQLSVKDGDVLLLVGTMKGLFLLTEEGKIRPHVNLFVDADNVRDLGGLAARLPAGSCEIAILPAVSGG